MGFLLLFLDQLYFLTFIIMVSELLVIGPVRLTELRNIIFCLGRLLGWPQSKLIVYVYLLV